jgi:DNA-binding MarR family transcriptional regulator
MLLSMTVDENDEERRLATAEAIYGLAVAVVRRGLRDISLTSLSTMATLERSGARRVTELATIEGVSQPGMTSAVTALERSGYVTRRPDPSDQRVVLVDLAPAGLAYLRARRNAGAEVFSELIVKLSEADAAALDAATGALQHLAVLDGQDRSAPGRDGGQS